MTYLVICLVTAVGFGILNGRAIDKVYKPYKRAGLGETK